MPVNRVVITGRGAVSPFGLGVASLSEAVWNNSSGVKIIEEWRSVQGLHSFLAAPVPPFNAKERLPRTIRRTMGPMSIYATLAAQEAVADAEMSGDFLQSGAVGVVVGSTTGSPQTYEEFYRGFLPENNIEEVKSGVFFKIMGHSCSANICHALGINGEQWAPASACTSSSQALGLGYLLVRSGRQDALLCGGADEVHYTVSMVFDVVKAASRSNEMPESTPRPFDEKRDGVVCGGGSGVLVLERLDSARARGAKIYAEVIGFGNVNDSKHIANPHKQSMSRAIQNALNEAGLKAQDIDYVNAHATGTMLGDTAESLAIESVLGRGIPVSSLKGHFGHTLGAAGALETIVVLEMLDRQNLVPTLNLDKPDPKCADLHYVQAVSKHPLRTVIKNNFALGGVNTALVLRRWTDDI